jgi:hypothetical protein
LKKEGKKKDTQERKEKVKKRKDEKKGMRESVFMN